MSDSTASSSNDAEEMPPIPLTEVASKGGLDPDSLVPHGGWAARVPWRPQERSADRSRAKMILVTAATPTKAGIGKTVTTIGLTDGLNALGHQTVATLRQPALGPTLGMKGGAAGGGRCRVVPSERVNLGLLGDFDAISHAQNLLVAAGDNSRFQGDPHGFGTAPLLQRRVWHINDRALRRVTTHPDGAGKIEVETGIDLVAACETMAIMALASSPADMRARVGRMVVALDRDGKRVTADDLEVGGAMAVLLRDAVNPTLLSTLDGNAVLFQAGPFANLGPGVSGVIADKVALAAADYVVTEAGFGSDLGAEKYLNLKVPAGAQWPDAVVLVTTVRSFLQHAPEGASDPLAEGLANISAHLDNLKNFNVPVVLVVNRHPDDDASHVRRILDETPELGAISAVESFHFADGAEGARAMAEAVVAAAAEQREPGGLYEENDLVKDKVEAIASKVYGAGQVVWSERAIADLEVLAKMGLDRARPCMVKTPASLSASAKKMGRPTGFDLPIKEVRAWDGAGIAVPLVGKVLTLPGLPKRPGAADYEYDPETGAIRKSGD
jgi:formate--tetrahydrofolate ligase